MLFEKCDDLYKKIAKIIWKIMPKDALKYIFECEYQMELQHYRMYWIDHSNIEKNYALGDTPVESLDIINLYSELKDVMSRFGSDWTQSRFTLDENGTFDVKFAYILEEDSWPMLYLRGISDLSEKEIKEYGVPRDIWEERVKARKEKQDS